MAWFLIFLALQCVLHVSAGEADENTVASLMALKIAVTHDPYSVLQTWNETARHYCNWTGVKCATFNRQMFVVAINLGNLSLGGFIPSHIANLSNLQFLDLSFNSFDGQIPAALGSLHKLKQLYLSKNNLTGKIPSEFGNLRSLEILSSYGNNHSGSIPETLGNCSMLRKIDLAQNQFTGTLAPPIGKLSRLVFISLDDNYLTGSLPPCLFNLTALQNFSLSFNGISGSIASNIGARLPNLEWLLLAGNNISGGIPKSLANCSRLSHLELAYNKLGGVIPQELGKLSRLTTVNMPFNEFVSVTNSGPIPILEALSNCSKLQKLDLSANHLTGTLPGSIFSKLSAILTFLNLEKNNIGGSIPKEIGNLSAVIELYMDKNSLIGVIPSEIGSLLSLAAIDLSTNKLQGIIPEEIRLLNQSLQYLYLNDNLLSGSIPENVSKLEYLRTLNLSMNRLEGRIPSAIANLQLLEDLHLCCNKFSGRIPSEIANLRNLNSFLDLSNNTLTGPVPAGIGGMQMIQGLDLSLNNLSGSIPAQITGLVGLQYLNLSHNHLQGIIPSAIGEKLSILNTLDLAHNNITGPVPVSISKLEMLEILNLSYNNFTGQIPCSGAIKKMNRTSFLGNPGLCGNCSGLTPCSSMKPQKKRKTILIGVSAGIAGALILTGLVICIIWNFIPKRLPRSSSQRTSLKIAGNLKISMQELKRATGNYNRDNLIGAGSYGSVYRGVLSSGEIVAVKVFRASNTELAENSFIKECQTLGKIRHRNLVKIITSCSTSEFQALVLPFMAKGSLYDHLHGDIDGRLSLQRRLSILCDVAHGLSYLHHDCTPQIVHCDLKPQNVLLDDDMTAHVADFGIARVFSPTDDATSITSSLKGTVGYIPPEYGVRGTISTKGDVYSYGILMLEMLVEKQPSDEMFTTELPFCEWVSTTISSILESCIQTISLENIDDRDEDFHQALKNSILEGLLQLGLWCTNQTPNNRPSMQQVESILVKMSNVIYHNHNNAPTNIQALLTTIDSSRFVDIRSSS